MENVSRYDAETLEPRTVVVLEEKSRLTAFYRVDLHSGLRDTALGDCAGEGDGKRRGVGKAVLHLGVGSRVLMLRKGVVEFAAVAGTGEERSARAEADLAVGADGIHSVRSAVVGNETGSGNSLAEKEVEKGTDSGGILIGFCFRRMY